MRPRVLTFIFGILGGAHLLSAGLILNPGFEDTAISGTAQRFDPGQTLGAWTVSGTAGANVHLLKNTYAEGFLGQPLSFNPRGGTYSLDITGEWNSREAQYGGAAGGVYQTLNNLCIGCTYDLSFWVGNLDNAVVQAYTLDAFIDLFIDDQFVLTARNGNNTALSYNWQKFTYRFVPTSSSMKIAFVNSTPAGDVTAYGRATGLDDVDLALISTPEPSSLLLLAGGLAAFIYRRR